MKSNLTRTAKNTGQGAACKRIWSNHPYLKQVTETVVAHFHGFKYKGFALTEIAIAKAALTYHEVAKNKQESTQPHYLAALFNALASSGSIQFSNVSDSAKKWNPLKDVSFLEFSETQIIKYAEVRMTEAELQKRRKALLLKFIDDSEAIRTICKTSTATDWLKT